MKLITILLAATLVFAGNVMAAPQVLVQHNEQYHGYMQLPRLAEVLVAANKQPGLYWPAARLYNRSADKLTRLEQQRQQLLQRLTALQQHYNQHSEPELAAATAQLQQQISQWQLAEQLLLPLDPDRVRAKPELNPMLAAGHYLLQVSTRPTRLSVTGLARDKSLPLINATDAADYGRLLTRLPGASTSFIYILPAARAAIVAQTGIWNHQPQQVAPGAVLFVPFEARRLPAAFNDINGQIVELLQHRVGAE